MINNVLYETERLIIRPYREDDLPGCFLWTQNEEIYEYLKMKMMTFEEYKAWLGEVIKGYDEGFGGAFRYVFAVCLKESGEHIGWVHLSCIGYDPSIKEIGWVIAKDHWRKGYATEGAKAMLDMAFAIVGLDEVIAICKPGNQGSINIIERLGMKYQGLTDGVPEEYPYYIGLLKYKMTKKEYNELY